MRLRISQIWKDDDGMREYSLFASSRGQSTSIEFYAYPENLSQFGALLSSFGGGRGEAPVFEMGSADEPHATWLRICAYAIDSLGHSALEICTNRNADRHVKSRAEFSGQVEVASINRLGKAIESWISSADQELDVSLTEA